MTVAELIEKLKFMPQDMMVVIPGYEGGYDNPEISSSTLVPDTNWNGTNKNHWYNGRHDHYYEMEGEGNIQPVACVVVGRGV
jgi:hypothetical protein